MAWKKPVYDDYPKVTSTQLKKVTKEIHGVKTELLKFTTYDLRLMRIDAEGMRQRHSNQTLLAVIIAFYFTFVSDMIIRGWGFESGFLSTLATAAVIIAVGTMMSWFNRTVQRATIIIGAIDLILAERNER